MASKTIARLTALSALLSLLLTGCGSGTFSFEPGEVTLADNGQSLALEVGERFVLKLGREYTWAVTIGDDRVAGLVAGRVVNVPMGRDAQGLYQARKAGQTTLTAIGDPTCRKSNPPCEKPSVRFELTLVVR